MSAAKLNSRFLAVIRGRITRDWARNDKQHEYTRLNKKAPRIDRGPLSFLKTQQQIPHTATIGPVRNDMVGSGAIVEVAGPTA